MPKSGDIKEIKRCQQIRGFRMFSKWLTITLCGVGNDIPTRLGKSRLTLTPVALHRLYRALDSEYNRGESSPPPDIESKWVAEQLILLPNYLLSLGEKAESVRLYRKFIRIRPPF